MCEIIPLITKFFRTKATKSHRLQTGNGSEFKKDDIKVNKYNTA